MLTEDAINKRISNSTLFQYLKHSFLLSFLFVLKERTITLELLSSSFYISISMLVFAIPLQTGYVQSVRGLYKIKQSKNLDPLHF